MGAKHHPHGFNEEHGDGFGLASFGLAKQCPITKVIPVFERWRVAEASEPSSLQSAVGLVAVVIALHFNLEPQVVAPRKLHKPGILHWCIADEGVFVGDHDDVVASLAHVSGQPLLARLEATQGLKLFEVEFRHGYPAALVASWPARENNMSISMANDSGVKSE